MDIMEFLFIWNREKIDVLFWVSHQVCGYVVTVLVSADSHIVTDNHIINR